MSHQLEDQLIIVLKYPLPFFCLPSLQRKDSSSSQDKDDMVRDLDFHISTSLEPSPFNPICTGGRGGKFAPPLSYFNITPKQKQSFALMHPDF